MPRWRELALTVVVIFGVCAILVRTTQAPIADQAWLLWAGFADGIPPFESGMSSRAISATVKAVTPNKPVVENIVMRCVAAAGAIGAVSLALVAAGAPLWLFALCLAVFVTSGFPFLWVSTELVATTGVALICATTWMRAPRIVFVGSVLLAAFAKPDMLIPVAALGAGAAFALDRGRLARTIVVALAIVVLLSGLSLQPSTGRLTMSFGQHYALLKYGHTDPGAFTNWERYRDADFGRSAQFTEIVRQHPGVYVDFVQRSARQSALLLRHYVDWPMLVLGAWACWRLRQDPIGRAAVAFFALSAVIITALSSLHHRYMARVLGLSLVLAARAIAVTSPPGWQRAAVVAGLIAMLGWQLTTFPATLASGYAPID